MSAAGAGSHAEVVGGAGADQAAPDGARLEPTFDARFADGARALLWVLPPGAPRAVVLCLQPFAEEANLSRRMIVAQARRLAARGYAVLVPDLYGTGDSAGEFEAITLARWRDDVSRAAAIALARTEAPLVLWGVRFGALLAADCAARLPARALVAWHAQRDGGEPVAQFRRLARLRALARRAPAAAAATAVGAGVAAAGVVPGVGEPFAPGLAEEKPVAVEPSAGEPVARKAIAGKPVAVEPAAGRPPATEPPATEPPARSTAEPPSAVEPSVAPPVESGGYRIAPALIEAMQTLRWPSQLPCALYAVEQADVPFWHALDAPLDAALFQATEQALEALHATEPTVPGPPDGATTAPRSGASGTTNADPALKAPLAPTAPTAPQAPGDRSEVLVAAFASVPAPPVVSAWPAVPAAAVATAATAATDQMVSFESDGRVLRGVLHPAAGPVGVVVVPGQPQTRVGSHRMFVQLARALAAAGHPVLRYDLAGYGDSDGEPAAYDAWPGDVAAAAAALRKAAPGVQRVAAWGLCDGATAAALASDQVPQLAGLVLLNPWVHDESLRAQAIVGSHYRGRLASSAFWRRLLAGQVQVGPAVREAAGHVRRALASRGSVMHGSPAQRLLRALRRTSAPACIVLSGGDLTASEMEAVLAGDPQWRQLGPQLHVERLPRADHTLSDSADLQRMIDAALAFVARL